MNTFDALVEVNRSRKKVPLFWFLPPLVLGVLGGPLLIVWLMSLAPNGDAQAIIFIIGIFTVLAIVFGSLFFCVFKIDGPLEEKENELRALWAKELGLGRASGLPKDLTYEDAVHELLDKKDGELYAYRLVIKNGEATLEDGKGNIVPTKEPKPAEAFSGVAVEDPNADLWMQKAESEGKA